MSAQVWKFPLNPGVNFIEMPKGSELLHVAVQHDQPCVWARVFPDQPPRDRLVFVVGTGHDIDGSPDYLGSFMLEDGALVFHAFASPTDLPPRLS